MKARAALFGLALAALFPSLSAAHVDGMTLFVSLGATPDQVTLDWSGGEPAYHIYRSTVPANLIAPGNLLGNTQVRTYGDTPGLGGIFFYMLSSDCQYSPPEN